MSRYVAVAGVVVSYAAFGCGDAITLEIASDRPIPQAIDSICVGVADMSSSGGQFGQLYRLTGDLASLPQTLRLEPGEADRALAWVRADRGGVPALYESAAVDFGSDVTLGLPKCQAGGSSIATRETAAGPAGALLVASYGQGGALVVAVAQGEAALVDARDGGLVVGEAPLPSSGAPVAAVAADVDGDCDDDVVIATDAAAPVVWLRDGATFKAGASIGNATVAALATGDADRDGDLDLVLGGGGSLQLWRNDGAGAFTHEPAALSAGSRASAISALALGDLDGDGNPDLVVGQAGPPLVAWLGGVGSFTPADGVLPAVPLDVVRMMLADADGDFDPDLAVSIRNASMRLYIDRDGRLEDQSFVRLPQPAPVAHAVAFGGWDPGCEPDAVIAADVGVPTLRGLPTGAFEAESTKAPGATDAVMLDLDDDGDLDAVLATSEGARWLAR